MKRILLTAAVVLWASVSAVAQVAQEAQTEQAAQVEQEAQVEQVAQAEQAMPTAQQNIAGAEAADFANDKRIKRFETKAEKAQRQEVASEETPTPSTSNTAEVKGQVADAKGDAKGDTNADANADASVDATIAAQNGAAIVAPKEIANAINPTNGNGKSIAKRAKIDRGITQQTFMPKGTWFAGGTISYTDIGAGSYKFLLFDDLTTKSFLFSFKAFAGYTFANNVAAGLSFDYSRTLIQIDNVDMNLGSDLNFAIKDFYSIQQIYTATAFLRAYINIGNSKRFGMFNDVRAYFGGGQGKITNGQGEELSGTYEKITKMGLVLAPGISVFATDFMTVEATIGIFGIEYSRSEQISNQVYQGSFETFTASFKLNLLSIGLGLAFYF